jgi:hypothetical protein
MVTDVLTSGMLSAGLLELIKFAIRKAKKDMAYDFPQEFYLISIPVLNVLMPLLMFYGLGMPVTAPILGMTLLEGVRFVAITLVSSAISVLTYTGAIKPMKNYARELSTITQ